MVVICAKIKTRDPLAFFSYKSLSKAASFPESAMANAKSYPGFGNSDKELPWMCIVSSNSETRSVRCVSA